MYKFIVVFISVILLVVGCKHSKPALPVSANQGDTSSRFPIMEMIREDALDIEKTPYFIYKTTMIGQEKKYSDSSAISAAEVLRLISPVLKIDIGSTEKRTKYKEVSFQDLTTNSITIITTSLDESDELKSLTALLNNETNKLKTVFAVFGRANSDSSIKTTYYWKAGKSILITKSVTKNNMIQDTREFINWNDIAQ